MADEEVFTTPQWEAARVLVARMRAEAAEEEFDSDALGVSWSESDIVVATIDDSIGILSGDMLYASLALMWTLICQLADIAEVSHEAVVENLGLSLAINEPQKLQA